MPSVFLMYRKIELALIGIAVLGLLFSRSPVVVFPPLTLGWIGLGVFLIASMGIFSDDIKGFFDLTAY